MSVDYFSFVLFSSVALLGGTVILGWVCDIPVFRHIHPEWVSMKFNTALSFLFGGLGGMALGLTRRWPEYDWALEHVRFFLSLSIFGIMSSLLLVSVVGGEIGITRAFADHESGVKTIAPGMPSVGTIIAFSLMAISGLIRRGKHLGAIGIAITWIGILSTIGYVASAPIFYYYIPGYSTAMAIHTGIGFSVAGLALTLDAWQ